MEPLVEPVAPVTFGCTVDDVLRFLPHVTVDVTQADVPGVSNPLYMGRDASGDRTGRRLTRADVEAFKSMRVDHRCIIAAGMAANASRSWQRRSK